MIRALASRDHQQALRAIDEHMTAFEQVMIGQSLDFLPTRNGKPQHRTERPRKSVAEGSKDNPPTPDA
jgi:hypothetical protein